MRLLALGAYISLTPVSALESPHEQDEAAALKRTLVELLALEREIVELGYVRRADALERVRDAVRRLGEVGSAGFSTARPRSLGLDRSSTAF